MAVKDRIEGLVKLAAGRPGATIAVVLALAATGSVLASGLEPSAGTDTFVPRSSSTFRATEDNYVHFGGDPVEILINEPLTRLVETKDLETVTSLEACLAGDYAVPNEQLRSFTPAPAGAHAPYGGWGSPCGKLMRAKPVQVVYGPGTFLNRAVAAVNTQVSALLKSAQRTVASATASAYRLALSEHDGPSQARAKAKVAGQLASRQEAQQLALLYVGSGIAGYPRIDDKRFIAQVVFGHTRGANQPKARFAYLFPTASSALIQVRLKAGLSDAEQAKAISWVRQAVKMPMFRSAYGGTYTVTGEPVVAHDLAAKITGSIPELLIAAVLVMAAVLLIVFRSRLRLLPLVIALVAVAITFGATSLAGASLTIATIAVLPVLIGLAVDYAIQFQSRTQEARSAGGRGTAEAIATAAGAGAPTIVSAALATATGFLVLLLSPVPMVRGFGVLLVIGIAVALVCALTAGSAAIALADRDGGTLGASLRGAVDILGELRARLLGPLVAVTARPVRALRRSAAGLVGGAQSVLDAVVRRPVRVLAAGLVLAAAGWVADAQTSVQSDLTKLVPASMPALSDLHTLERLTGMSGEIDVTVRSSDVTKLRTVRWMLSYERALLEHYGYLETEGCVGATLCPALSLPELLSAGSQDPQDHRAFLNQSSIRSLLAAVPTYFSQAVLSPDHREATLAFGIRLMPLSRQQGVIDYMSSKLHPPPGAVARLTGLPVLAANANAALSSSSRRLLTLLAGLTAVGLVLLALFRRPERALAPLVPIALATGWSALILFAIGIPLNPMSATLGTLVIAISTEFSVLLSERFRQERAAGRHRGQALAHTYRSTGTAVLASGITAIAGFGVLVFSDITMLRDFGFVTLVDLTVSLAGVLIVLPAVLVRSERDDLLQRATGSARRGGHTLPRPRRRLRRQRIA